MSVCRTLSALLLLSLPLSCTNTAEETFSRRYAFLHVQPVTALAPLRAALTSPGEWCVLTLSAQRIEVRNAAGHMAQLPLTATAAYGPPQWIGGLLVGTPALPNTSGQFETRCYDAACPSCYEAGEATVRTLQFTSTLSSTVICPRCARSYDLALGGVVVAHPKADGQGNPRLYRYRHSYLPLYDRFVVQN